MKRIIRLTESDLARIVRRVINEQDNKNFLSIVEDKENGKTYCADLRTKDDDYYDDIRSKYGNRYNGTNYIITKVAGCEGIYI